MGDDNTNQKKRKSKWTTSYSNMSRLQAEKRLGFRIRSIKAISVDRMLANAKYSLRGEYLDVILKTKERVYDNIVEYLAIEGYPTEGDPDFKEASINHLVYATISPVLGNFIRMTRRNSIQLRSEKEIVSTDGEIGSTEEFVVVDLISVEDEKFILIVEAKRSSLGQAMKQCLLAMKDMRDNNGGVDEVYGFVTTGESWRMISYDGTFQVTNKIDLVFNTMGDEKDKWMKDYSVLVDCIHAVLSKGGIVEE
ncbi:hypothetical protein BDD12DRAFT_809643 [Trichophaea hybrida]|nr:hypothetical protein BDD12DRAFT_810687 [Trichophaea hybrida]KAF8534117.1 hypothetical protein BDD12DRAFT_809643 [Trichophaea hybrida]